MTVPVFGPDARVGLVGLGVMGGGMARCLRRNGYALNVWTRRPEAAQPFVLEGAQALASLAEVGAQSDLMILCLTDGAAVEQVLFGAGGLASSLRPGMVVVDTSTIAAHQARTCAQRLQAQGVAYLDAPVSGGQQGAETGTLGCMVGGDAQALDACRPVLQAFCKAITHVGASGAGQTVKACNQVAVAGAMLGVADAVALARQQGVDPSLMREVLLGGTARSFPLEKHAPRMIGGNYTPGFRARLMRKDLRLALATAQDGGGALPLATLAEQLLDALCEGGRADWDWCAVALQAQQRLGLPVPDAPEPQ